MTTSVGIYLRFWPLEQFLCSEDEDLVPTHLNPWPCYRFAKGLRPLKPRSDAVPDKGPALPGLSAA